MGENCLFIPSARLGAWLTSGRAQLEGNELTVARTGHRLRLVEAVRVVTAVTDEHDPDRLAGRVLSLEECRRRGAEMLESSMVVGDAAYDVVSGFEASPIDSGAEVPVEDVVSVLSMLDATSSTESTDDDLLARYLMQKLM